MTVVTLVTANATADNLSEQDYREIYEENRKGRSIRQFQELLASSYSIAWWSKYERREIALTREARCELRRLVGLPVLPPTVEQAAADVDPDAQVWRVGDQVVERVILIGEPGSLVLNVNGTVKVAENGGEDPAQDAHQGRCNRGYSRHQIKIGAELWERLNAARTAANLTWAEFLGQLVEEG